MMDAHPYDWPDTPKCQHCGEDVKFGLPPAEDRERGFYHVATGKMSCAESGLPDPMTNDQIAEMIVCMTESEHPLDVIQRVALWGDEEWSQCDVERNARRLTSMDRFEIIGMITTKLATQMKGET